MHEIQTDIDFVSRKEEDIWWYDGEIVSLRSKKAPQILRLMRNNPYVTYVEINKALGVNISAIQKLVKRMIEKGYIVRQDDGAWRVLATSVV